MAVQTFGASTSVGQLARKLCQPSRVFLDIETTGLNPRQHKVVAVQLRVKQTTYILDTRKPWGWVPVVKTVLEDAQVVGHNLKFDLAFLYELGIAPQDVFDTMLAQQLIYGLGMAEARMRGKPLSLEGVAAAYNAGQMSKEERSWFIDLDKREDEWAADFPAQQVEYMATDVDVLPTIFKAQLKKARDLSLETVTRLEMDTLPALVAMEAKGIQVNVEGWRAFIAEKQAEADGLEAEAMGDFALPILQARLEVYDAALAAWQAEKAKGVKGLTRPKQDNSLPNLNSPTQLLDAFQAWGLGVASTSSLALADVDDERVARLLAYRKSIKFVQSFGETLLAKVEDGRIHPEYVQIGASTGRMSCRNPNWQQVPSRGDGQRLRQLVVPEKGNVLVVADFSNIELRILAALSKDKHLTKLFASGKDLHSELAYTVFKLDRDVDVEVECFPGTTWTYRTLMKTVNYGLVYGMSSTRLSRLIHVSRQEADAIMADYFKHLGGVKKWMAQMQDAGEVFHKVHTESGRIRVFDDDDEAHRIRRQAANTPIQGTSADITKQAVANFHQANEDADVSLVAVVHDELVVECPKSRGKAVATLLEESMDTAQQKFITLPAGALPRPKAKVSAYWAH